MTTFFATLTPMLTLFFCIAVGFVLCKCKILPDATAKVLAKAETWIFCPALSFMTMVRFCTVETLSTHLVNILLATACVALGMTVAILLARLFIRTDCSERGVYQYALAFSNGGYMGDPIVLALLGEAALSYYKLFYLPYSLMINSWGISVLTPKSEGKRGIWKRLLNAPTVSMLLGIAVGLCGLGAYLPEFLVDSLDSLKVCMGPVAMLLAGFTIARYDFLSLLKKTRVYAATALRLVVLPTMIIAFLFGLKTLASLLLHTEVDNNVLYFAFFATATPLGLNTVVFPEAYGGNPETGASMTLISHTLCVISIPLLYALLVSLFGTYVV